MGRISGLALALVLAGCATSLPLLPSATPSPASLPTSSPSLTAAATPTPSVPASRVPLPSAGGTCSASQIVVGKATYGYGYGALGTTVVFVTLPLRNVGGDCVLHLPAVIGVASATGPFEAVSALDAGTESATGVNSPAESARIRSGRSLSIVLGDWWRIDTLTDNGTPVPAPPCLNPISDVTRVEFPLATGSLQVDLPTVLRQVCSSPASMSLTIRNG